MDLKKIENVIKVFESSRISTLEVDDSKTKISLKQKLKPIIEEKMAETASSILVSQPPVDATSQEEDNYITVKSDGVGFFHHKVSESNINTKSKIKKGSAVYSIKSMNIDHDKNLEKDSIIIKYLVEEGAPIEYGQELVIIKEL